MELMKRICSAVLTLCMVISMISGIAMPVSATEQSYHEKYGMKYYQLFGTDYLKYISPQKENDLLNKAIDAYLAVLEDYEGGKDFAAKYNYALREGGINMFINEGLALFGIRDTLEEEFNTTATRMLATEMGQNKSLVEISSSVLAEKLSIFEEYIDVSTDAGIKTFCGLANRAFEGYSDKAIVFGTKELLKHADKINTILPHSCNIADAFISYFSLFEMQAEPLRRLKNLLPAKKSDLDEELEKLLDEIHENAIENVGENLFSDTVTTAVSQALEKWVAPKVVNDVGTKIIKKLPKYDSLAWALGDGILKHGSYLLYHDATAEEIYYTICLSSYVIEIGNALTQKKIEIIKAYQVQQPIGSAVIEDYEFLYSSYLSAIRATLDSALKTAKTREKKQQVEAAISLMDTYSYDVYVDFCMNELENAIAAGAQTDLSEKTGFPTACLKAETAISGTFVVSKDNANIMDRPCSVKTDMLSALVESAPLNKSYEVVARCENTQGNDWYKIITSSGETGYIYSGNGDYIFKPDVSVAGLSVPTTLTVGSRYWIKGTVSAQNATLLTVSFNVYDANGALKTGGSADVNGKSYVLENSIVDTLTEFNLLEAGTYKCELIATADTGMSCEQITLYSGELLINTSENNSGAMAADGADFVARSDGVWLYPLPKENYSVNDWAGCPGQENPSTYPEGYRFACSFPNCGCTPGCAAHTGYPGGHNGIDLYAELGTEVYASAGGILFCTSTDWSSRGITAVVEHPISETGWSYYTIYQHLSWTNTSKNACKVEAGEVIAKSGNTDGAGTGQAHLHFEILLAEQGQGNDLATNMNALLAIESSGKWVLTEGFQTGRILNNPALNSPAGTPAFIDTATQDTCQRHAGSVMYTFNPEDVCIGESVTKMVSEETETQRIMRLAGQIGGGGWHTVVLKPDGTAIANGENSEGQCNVEAWSNLAAVAAGDYHTLGLRNDGTVYATGRNTDGQCNVQSWKNIVMITAGDYHTLGLKKDGTIVATGRNDAGQCNVSKLNDYANGREIIAIAGGYKHSVALYSDGTVYAIGENRFGQLNVTDWENVIAIYAGVNFTVGLKSDGTVYAVGEKDDGQLNITQWKDVVYLSVGDYFTIGVDRNGSILRTGRTKDGQLNLDSWKNIVAIGAGHAHTVAITTDGRILAIGDNSHNQLSITTEPTVNLYAAVVRSVKNSPNGCGMLIDMDDDGTQELILLYVSSSSEWGETYCSVYDIENGKVVEKLNSGRINTMAGVPITYVGMAEHNGEEVFIIHTWTGDFSFSSTVNTLYDPETLSIISTEKSDAYDAHVAGVKYTTMMGWGRSNGIDGQCISGMTFSELLQSLS